MVYMTIRRVRLPADLVLLLLDLVMMEIVDLAMMSLNWEVPMKSAWDARGRHCSVQRVECELWSCVVRFW